LNAAPGNNKTTVEIKAANAFTGNTDRKEKQENSNAPIANNDYAERKALNRKIKKLERLVQEREDEVSKLEKQLESIQNELNTPQGACRPELHEQYIREKKALDNALSYWEMAATELESLKINS